VDADRFTHAGLLDASDPDAEDRLGLLRYLAERGITIEEMVDADRDGDLTVLVLNHRLERGEHSAVELARRAGMDLDEALETFRILGIDVPDADTPIFDAGEERILELLATARALLPEGMAEEIMRSINAGLSLVAESEVAAFVGSVEEDLVQGSARTRAQVTAAAGELALEVGSSLGPLLRHHLRAAVHRQRTAQVGTANRRESEMAVGFVDIVGYTPMTETMESAELLAFVNRFHSRTFDLVTAQGGRVVKHIGDEVMFTSPSAGEACRIALTLVEGFSDLASPPRGGLAHGVVVVRHGDCYGPTVNLAARLADIAAPGEVLAAAAVADTLDTDALDADALDTDALDTGPGSGIEAGVVVSPAGQRTLKGFRDPVPVVALHRPDP
jgi:class 3 adenylate cyclase